MAGNFAVIANQGTTSSSNKTVGTLIAAATVVPRLYDFTISASGTPADNALVWTWQRMTADGTGTSVTPRSISYSPGIVAPVAALCTAKSNYTVEGTYTASTELFSQGINQRAAYRWVAAPGGELVVPAVAAAALGLLTKSAGYTGQADATYHWQE